MMNVGVAGSTNDLLALVKILSEEGIDKKLQELRDVVAEAQKAQANISVREETLKKVREKLDQDVELHFADLTAAEKEIANIKVELKNRGEQLSESSREVAIKSLELDAREVAFSLRVKEEDEKLSVREKSVSSREVNVTEREKVATALKLDYEGKLKQLKAIV